MFQSLDQVLPCLISALDLGSCGFTVAYVMSQADLLVSRTFQTMQDLEHIFVRCMFFHYPYQFIQCFGNLVNADCSHYVLSVFFVPPMPGGVVSSWHSLTAGIGRDSKYSDAL